MRILALDSSGLVAGVAVAWSDGTEEEVLAEYTVNYKKTHSQTLLPMLDETAKMIELDMDTIDAVAVAAGPGSFTGLRIGSATAKGLGLALGIPLVAVPTLHGLAYNLWGAKGLVCPIMDARRGQVYTAIFEFRGDELVVVEDQMAIGIEELAEKLLAYDRKVTFLGDGVPVFRKVLEEKLFGKTEVMFAPANMNRQRAASVAALGLRYYREGKYEPAAEHAPEYLRMSQAERERRERQQKESGQQ
ncbi:MAG: tRNA (adenosine(37)-N6)-threonylcarbamoyltransferase complex dimerization subunit type 1 TsaB [Dorea sp.]|jgi:tRNA threonylcarbamoyladenosine biosynthesis protein TsaB|nr:tRNA (adenosine(37)-N6)-threonylcarbamoyltransferase complex dimerization subunit type 1 TsaB [Dorea sp.]MCI9248646.1 tRNA (adenosine(37)-N6)-threonylcarbamoyltransferase complex dimerization subunit type 1 TsaB [Dorea sp.]